MNEINYKQHWETVYTNKPFNELGWYEKESTPSLDLIQSLNLPKDAKIINVGVGASTIVQDLIKLGYTNIAANDISSKALAVLENQLDVKDKHKVVFIEDDLTNSNQIGNFAPFDIWHDRAVLHFFNSDADKVDYVTLLKKVLKPNAFAIIATFHTDGALKCSGLELTRYDENTLQELLGLDFKLVKFFNYEYTMPSGANRLYIYTLFQYCPNT